MQDFYGLSSSYILEKQIVLLDYKSVVVKWVIVSLGLLFLFFYFLFRQIVHRNFTRGLFNHHFVFIDFSVGWLAQVSVSLVLLEF